MATTENVTVSVNSNGFWYGFWETVAKPAVAYILNQGPSTVLLACLLSYLAYYLPQHEANIQRGYERAIQQHKEIQEHTNQSHERTVKYIMDTLRQFRG